MKHFKRPIAMLLAVIMLLSACPISAFATAEEPGTAAETVSEEATAPSIETTVPSEEATEPSTEATVSFSEATEPLKESVQILTSSEAAMSSDVPATAAIVAQGDCGDSLTWTLDEEGLLTISGEGAMTDFTSSNSAPWYNHNSSIKSISIQDGVSSIGSYAFYYCSYLFGTLTIPDSVVTIGSYAFQNCSNLTTLELGNGLTSIGNDAFARCYGLNGNLVIPDSVTSIGNSAFAFCNNLTGLTLGSKVSSIGIFAFESCNKMAGTLTVPDSVSIIGGSAFTDCTGFTGLTLGSGLTSINTKTFFGCTSLSKLELNDTLTAISSQAFSDCTALNGTISIPATVTSIGSQVFQNTGIDTIQFLGTTPPTMDSSAFSGISLTTVMVPSSAENTFTETLNTILPDTVTIQPYAPLVASGTCGQNLEWTLDESGLLTVSGEGNMYSYASSSYVPWNSYRSSITAVVFEDGVTSVGSHALRNCKNLTSLTLADTITNIGIYAFHSCSGLTGTLTIPDSVTVISNYAFYACTGLTALELGDKLQSIGDQAFYGCSKLAGILTIPDSVTSIGTSTFNGCNKLTTLELGSSLLSIGNSAFLNCRGLTGTLVIPDNVTSIGYQSFANCSGFTGLNLGAKVKTIGNNAFSGCSGLIGALVIPNSVTSIGSYSFQRCYKLTGLELGSSVATIGTSAFGDCGISGNVTFPASITTINSLCFNNSSNINSLTFLGETIPKLYTDSFSNMSGINTVYIPETSAYSYITALEGNVGTLAAFKVQNPSADFIITNGILVLYTGAGGDVVIPETVTTIGPRAFMNCTELTSVTFPEGLTSIKQYAFCKCTNLKQDLVIPDSVTSLGMRAFYQCKSLTGLSLGQGLTVIADSVFQECSGITGTLTIPQKITKINSNAFYYCSGLTALVLNDRLLNICSGAFEKTGIAGTLTIPDSVLTIDDRAFYGCDKLTGLKIGKSVTHIGTYAFGYCSALTDMPTLPEQLLSIGSYAFMNCSKLTGSLKLPDSLTTIGLYAFYNCPGFTGALIIPDSVTSIGSNAFYNCSGFTSLKLSNSLTSISSYAFRKCSGLTGTLTIPDSITTLNTYAFDDCTGLTGLKLSSGLTAIPNYAFRNCNGLTSTLTIPESVTSIGAYAFYNCSGLTGKLVIPDAVTKIDTYAFYGCSGFTGLELGNSLVTIEGHAFYQCKNMTGPLVIPDSVKTINTYAFNGCSGFTGELVIPDNVTKLSNCVFAGLRNITAIKFGFQMTTIGGTSSIIYNPFYSCSGVKNIVFTSATVPRLVGNMFNSMSKLETIYVPTESYDAYVSAYSGLVGENVKFSYDAPPVSEVTSLKPEKVYSKTAVLTWDPHASAAVTGYTILRDGTELAKVTDCTYTDRTLTLGQSYVYTVMAHTEDGAVSRESQITVTTVAPEILDIQTDSSYNKINDTNNLIRITVTDSGNLLPLGDTPVSAKLYQVNGEQETFIADAVLSEETAGLFTAAWDITDLAEGSYQVLFRLTDVDGTSDEYSETIIIDRSVPAKISNVIAVDDVNKVHINWNLAAEIDTTGYRIYRRSAQETDFTCIAEISGRNTLSYTDTTVSENSIYYYYVTGVNELGTEGEASNIAGATLSPDTDAPTVSKLSPANNSYLSGSVRLSLTAEDNVFVTGAKLSYSTDNGSTWTLIKEITGSSLSATWDTSALPDGKILVKGTASDKAGNESSPMIYTYVLDNHGPEKVTGLEYEATSVTVTLRWNDVADEDIKFFRVEQLNASGSYVKVQDVSRTLGVNLYNLEPGQEYTYRVVGYDARGNRGTCSDSITVKTRSDSTAPVISRIRPVSGYYSSKIDLSVTATDEYCVKSVTIQVSADLRNWTDVHSQTFTDSSASRTVNYTLSLDGYAEGDIYIRAIARDEAGNESNSGISAPYVQHIIDKTAPAAPQNVEAIGASGYIEIRWTQGSEQDLGRYSVYRSETESGTYVLLKDSIAAVNYYDRTAEDGKTYFYKVTVNDQAENESGFSQAVSAAVLSDTECPEILSIYPATGSQMGPGNSGISVSASDNNSLQSVLIEYSCDDGATYKTLKEIQISDSHGEYAAAQLPMEELEHSQTVKIRVSARDKAGNVSQYENAEYTIDKLAPAVASVTAQFENDCVTIHWSGKAEADLQRYRIYRCEGETETLIGYRNREENVREYEFVDQNLPEEQVTYIYKIEVADGCGNTSSQRSEPVELPDRTNPKPVISCDATMAVGTDYIIDATGSTDNGRIVSYAFDFGDGTTGTDAKAVHRYASAGTYTITLTVTDENGLSGTATKTVQVVDQSATGTVTILVMDEYGSAVPGAPVYFDLGEESQTMKTTDRKGYVTFTSSAGTHTIGCIIANNEWLPAKKDVIVNAGKDTPTAITLVHQTMIEGEFEIQRMTFEEIKAAGIDVTAAENQHIVKVNTSLVYGTSQQVQTSFIFNMTEGTVMDDVNDGSSSGFFVDSDGDGSNDRELIPVVLNPDNTTAATLAFLDLPIGTSFLKEFFDVNLHIINNAGEEFSMIDNVVTLNVPDGLTLVEGAGTEGQPTVRIPEIPGQTTKTVSWILRGDKAGEYTITADYSGVLKTFGKTIEASFISKDPLTVYGLDAVKLIAEINSSVNYDAFYFNLTLENDSGIDINLPSLSIVDNVLNTYLVRMPTDTETSGDIISTEWAPDVRHLNTVLENSAGNKQNIGSGTTLNILAPGEKLTQKYAAYNVVGYNNQLLLIGALTEVKNTSGIRFEVIETDMDLFNMDNPREKLEALSSDKKALYDYILRGDQFFYVKESVNRDESILGQIAVNSFVGAREEMNIDGSDAADETQAIVRKLFAQLLIDEAMQQAISNEVDNKYTKIVTKVLRDMEEFMESQEDRENAEKALKHLHAHFGNQSSLRKLAQELKQNGYPAFFDLLKRFAVSDGADAAVTALLDDYCQDERMQKLLHDAFSSLCPHHKDAVEGLDEALGEWYQYVDLAENMIVVSSAYDEAVALLDMLRSDASMSPAVLAELNRIETALEEINEDISKKYGNNVKESDLEKNNNGAKKANDKLNDNFGADNSVSAIYARLLFGSIMDHVAYWDTGLTGSQVLKIHTDFSFALTDALLQRNSLEAETDEDAIRVLNALKYLIKVRMLGEQSYAFFGNLQDSDTQSDNLVWVNTVLGIDPYSEDAFPSLDAYASYILALLQEYRDTIFTTYYTKLDVPAAPTVTINYLKETTQETFSSTYEYSYDGSTWHSGTGAAIALNPGSVPKALWVRAKATATSFAGNTTKLLIPARPRLLGDVTIVFDGDEFIVTRLSGGTYRYEMTDKTNLTKLTKEFSKEDGIAWRYASKKSYAFLALQAPASESMFASLIRYVATRQSEFKWMIKNNLLIGLEEDISSTHLASVSADHGHRNPIVTDPKGNSCERVGTGYILEMDDQKYILVVNGDVDGDTYVNDGDVDKMLSHISYDDDQNRLKDEFHEAACVHQDEQENDINIFDVYAVIDHINTHKDNAA